MFGEVRVQLRANDADFLVGMNHGFAIACALAEHGAREQGRE
jgi:hypothetical protein